MDWLIAIPSYKRASGVVKKTLKVLKEYEVPPDRIHIFVNSDQVAEYKTQVGSGATVIDRGSASNPAEARNAIIDYFPEGQKLIMLDDDISAFKEVQDGKLVRIHSLIQVIERGFALCSEHKFHMWGLYPITNAFYMKGKGEYSTDLKFIVGAFLGIINLKITCVAQSAPKEDYYLGLKYYEFSGGMIRFNHICVSYDICPKSDKDEISREHLRKHLRASEFLVQKFPHLVRSNTQREGEILFKKLTVKKP
jgi:hypothetical protein